MSGFTTTATIAELINKRPIKKKKRKRSNKSPFKSDLKATQRVLRLVGR